MTEKVVTKKNQDSYCKELREFGHLLENGNKTIVSNCGHFLCYY